MICGMMSSSDSTSPIFNNPANFQIITENPVMRPSLRLLAMPTAVGSTNGLKPAPLALLPPIPLYRRLLRAHRKHLDPQMRLLGDEYIKGEFRSHCNVENPMHIVSFTLCYGWQPHETLTELIISTDWIFDRVADVRPKYRGRLLEGRENRQGQD